LALRLYDRPKKLVLSAKDATLVRIALHPAKKENPNVARSRDAKKKCFAARASRRNFICTEFQGNKL
jgi:hypothetical protein